MILPIDRELNILVIEDNTGDYLLISDYIEERFGQTTRFQAKTFKDAKRYFIDKNHSFDVILLDLSLPDEQGEILIKKILVLCMEVPVIVLSGNSDLNFSLKSLNLGVTDYLVKDELNSNTLFKSIVYSIERKEIGVQLQKTQKQYQDLFDLSPLPTYIYDVETLKFLDVNNATEQHYGYSKKEFKNMTLLDIRPKEDLPILFDAIQKLRTYKNLFTKGNYRHQKKNGEIIHVEIHGFLIYYRNQLAETIVVYDITRQKKYEDDILEMNKKLRHLSAHLQTIREEERSYIAREIHDELGQQLTGIKLEASWLKKKIEAHFPELEERTLRLISGINKTINDVRKISTQLRPGVLDDLGVEAAIEWQSNQFEEQTGIKCRLKFENIKGEYGKEINTSIYRIYQETLTNIMRHAQATEVLTVFSEKKNNLCLEVIDNGVGISETAKNNTFSLGLTGMRERALMVNGTFFIKKQSQGGTKVKVSVPLVR